MRLPHSLLALCCLSLLNNRAIANSDQFTALIASTLTDKVRPFTGTDHRIHVVYELVFTNTSATPATLRRIDVSDASDQAKILATYEGPDLLYRLRGLDNAPIESATIEYNGTRLFLIDFDLDSATVLSSRLIHRVKVEAASSPGRQPGTPVPLTYVVAPIAIAHEVPEITPPLAGKGWVAANGCCQPSGTHRSTSLAVNGKIYFAQRFAIDWMQLDKNGLLQHGAASDVHSYPGYGADVLAVADGTVVGMLNNLDDQTPGIMPDRKTITIENVDGNHVVLDLGNGVFAFYAHLQHGSVPLKLGDKVKRGQVLGKLGNTGNTSAPHLHFHLMDGASVLGSSGIPYVIDHFAVTGQLPEREFAAAVGVEGNWKKGLFSQPTQSRHEFPLNLNVVDFVP